MEEPRDPARSSRSSDTACAIALPPRRISWRWPIGCVLAILYASLLPFDFSPTTLHRAISNGLLTSRSTAQGPWSCCGLRFRSTTPDDAVTNLLVYVPVGLMLGICAVRGRLGRWTGAFLAVVVGATLSFFVETLQTGLASRVASCTDILLNGIGTTIGASLGIGLLPGAQAAMTQVRCELADRPFTTAASLLTLGLFLYNLAPFDFVMSTDALHASFGRAHWSLMDARVAAFGAPPFAAVAHELTGAGWFAVLGYLLALGGRECGRHPAKSLGSALKNGLILVVLVEFMQLFTRSHTFDSATVLIRSLGVLFGAWCALFLIDSLTGSAWRRKPSLALPTGIVAVLAVFQVGLLVGSRLNPTAGTLSTARAFVVQWLPLENLWRQSLHTAAAEVLSSLLTFGTLALTIRVLLQRSGTIHAGRWTFAALTLAATSVEGIRLTTLGTPMDVTTVLLAWISAFLVASWNAPPASVAIPSADRGTRHFSQNP